jgi:hypothetical protein
MTKSEIQKIVDELKPHLEAVISEAVGARLAEPENASATTASSYMQNLQRALDEKRQRAEAAN